ncbi:hypothetical protein EV198_0094 [Roseivirga ehrenbergii]|uniref:Uncharacterized protein n=1 Tax=Roseivirga ehrenbergii (strain DSM 102268 / JCM 13514 / KCTC 12282 / NCIMB 14502 / KMM 6017) TaxID=279360 RepID=A0A150WZY7_ROSEK|nr:hypothetical protein [Roseivirga ehrenbergii]KYG72049.1 hypothetical protein MB14_08315 [Roseivirga ehrenbergii]TCL13272.1 hypothetical protein EV198_0094 [Roseivirga ehrenbergii]
MKLAHYQIEHIRSYVKDQNIWYYDVQHELVDHIASAIETKMDEDQISFSSAFSQIIESINCRSIQRSRTKAATYGVHKSIFKELMNMLKTVHAFIPVGLFFSLYLIFNGLTDAIWLIKLFKTLSICAILLPLLISLFDRRFKPYNYTSFIGSCNGVFLYIIIFGFVDERLVPTSLKTTPFYYPIYFAIIFTGLYLAFNVIKKHYKNIKNHVAYR